MTSLEEKLTNAKKEVDFESEVLKNAEKFTKEEFKAEVDARINIIENFDSLDIDAEEKDRSEVLRRIKAEARVLSAMFLRKYS